MLLKYPVAYNVTVDCTAITYMTLTVTEEEKKNIRDLLLRTYRDQKKLQH